MDQSTSRHKRSFPEWVKSWLWCNPVRATCRRSLYLTLVLGVLAVLFVIAARVWFPGADQYKAELESYLCELTGQNVTIGHLETRFHGLTPSFSARNVLVHEKDQKAPSLKLAAVDADIDFLALLRGKPRVKKLIIESASLVVQRLSDGRFIIGGVGVGSNHQTSDLKGTLAKLLDQKHLELRNAHVVWRDQKFPDAPELVMEQADFKFVRDGDVHTLSLKADVGSLTPQLQIDALINGDVLEGPEAWDGNIHARVDALDIAALPPILAEAIHVRLSGRVDIDARSQWAKGGVVTGSADIAGAGVTIGVNKLSEPISLADFRNGFQWGGRVDQGDWELVSHSFDLALNQPDMHLRDQLRLVRQGEWLQATLGEVTVNDISEFVSAMDISEPAVKKLTALNPRGVVKNVVFDLPEGLSKPELFTLKTHVEGFENDPDKKIPGLRGISGELELSRFAGGFVLNSAQSSLNYPRYFSESIELDSASAESQWRKKDDIWQISLGKVSVKNPDLEADGEVHVAYPVDHAVSPQLKMDLNYRNGRGEHAAHYYPDKIMHKKLVDWLTSSIKGGRVTHGTVKFEGPVKAFPFYHDEGTFIIHADIADATLDYFPGWPKVEKSDVALRVNGAAMTITGTGGTLAGQTIGYVNAHIADLKAKDHHLKIGGELTGPANRVVEFLTDGPLRGKNAKPLHGWSADGEGDTTLSLDIPLSKPSSVQLTGKYLLKDVALKIPGGIEITGLNNSIEFTQDLVQCKNLSGQMLGGEVSIGITTPKPNRFEEVLIEGDGSADPEHLEGFLGDTITRALSGKADWKGAVKVTRKGVKMDISSDLKGLASNAPAPLNKAAKSRWPLLLKSNFASNDSDRTSFSLNSRLYGNMLFSGQGENYGLKAAKIVVGSGHGGWANSGVVEVVLDAEKLNADEWLDFFSSGSDEPSRNKNSKKPGFAEKLNRVAGKVGQLHALSREFGATSFAINRNARDRFLWTGEVEGDSATGNVEVTWSEKKKSVEASLIHLHWPTSSRAGRSAQKNWHQASLPDVSLASLETQYGDLQLGQMNLIMKPGRKRWEIHRLDLTRPDMTVKVSDQAVTTGPPGKTPLGTDKLISQFNVNLKSTDVAATLAALGYPDQLTGESANLSGSIFWRGGPEDFSWANLNADMAVEVKQGRILRIKPGLGRMLGALNLESLLRRLKLDFSDVYEKGFAFDKIAGDIRIRDGEGFSDELVINGPGANIIIAGRTALVDRKYNLRVTVIPPLGGNASLVGFALGGPAAGVLIWLGDKVLKHPLGKLIHYEYKVTGSWDEPVVESLGAVETGEQPGAIGGID